VTFKFPAFLTFNVTPRSSKNVWIYLLMCVKACILRITKRLSANVLGNGVPKNWMPTYCCFMIIIKFFYLKLLTVYQHEIYDHLIFTNCSWPLLCCYVYVQCNRRTRCLACICEVPILNLCLITVSPKVFVWLSLDPHDKFWVVPHVRPRPLPFTFFITHYILAVL
jgi:hypothetical protein